MRGIYFLLSFSFLGLLSPVYAGTKPAASVRVEEATDTSGEKEAEEPTPPPPPRKKPKEDKPKERALIRESEARETEEEVVSEHEEMPPAPAPLRHFSLSLNGSFGPQMGCFIPNCQSFMPIQRMCGSSMVQGFANQCMMPQQQPIMYQNVYVSEAPSNFQIQGRGMGCATCGGPGATSPVLFMNNTPTPIWATPNFIPRWQGLQVRTTPIWPVQQQAVFNLPQMPQQHTNVPEFGEVLRGP